MSFDFSPNNLLHIRHLRFKRLWLAVGLFLISSTLLNLNHYFNSRPYPFGETLWEFRKIAGELLRDEFSQEAVIPLASRTE